MGLLRYLLATLVLISHLGHTVLGGINPGVSAVVVFYMLAGHVVAGLWHKWHTQPGALGRFYSDRLWRILPQYLLACLAAALLWRAGAQSPFLAQPPGVLHWLAQFTVVPLAYYMYTGAEGFVLVPPAWSIWAWVSQMALRFRPRRSTSHSICSISPPGSMTAASMVWSHQTREQFCWKAVTGTV